MSPVVGLGVEDCEKHFTGEGTVTESLDGEPCWPPSHGQHLCKNPLRKAGSLHVADKTQRELQYIQVHKAK